MDASANVVVDIPNCLIIEIFGKLPVKSLCRFKCVSKFCLSFIEAPSFVDAIRPQTPFLLQVQSPEDNSLLVFSIDCCDGVSTMIHEYELKPHFPYFGDFKHRYCDGLNSFFDQDTSSLRVCNVAINEDNIMLPRWCQDYIFCFDSFSGKYKVLGWVDVDESGVLYFDEDYDAPLDFQVLTLERDLSWRPVRNSLTINYISEPDVIINGEPFWLDIYGRESERRILSFNPTNEEFRAIALPNETDMATAWYCIFDYEGSLSLVEQLRCQGPTFSLWILKGNDWVVMKKNITLPFEGTKLQEYYAASWEEYYSTRLEPWKLESFNFSSRGGEIVVTEFADYDYKFMFIYSFLNNQFKRINITRLPFSGLTRRTSMENGFMMRKYEEKSVSVQGLVSRH